MINIDNIKRYLIDKKPVISLAIGSTLLVLASYRAVKDTDKARLELKIKKTVSKKDLTKKEIVKTVVPCYISTGLLITSGIACITAGGFQYNKKEVAALALADRSIARLEEYKAKTKEVLGDKAATKVQEEIHKSDIKEEKDSELYISTGNGEQMFYDKTSGLRFRSSTEHVKAMVNNFNKDLLHSGFFSKDLNDLYELWGLPTTEIGSRIVYYNDSDVIDLKITAIYNDILDKTIYELEYNLPRIKYRSHLS